MQKVTTSKKIDLGISTLRIVSTFAVILLHTCSTMIAHSADYNLSVDQIAFFNCGTYLLYWAVPVFLMITGALLLRPDKSITPRQCITKYAKRVLLALLVFGIPFSIMTSFSETHTFNFSMIGKAILDIITGDSWGHLWYLYLLIGIYLILPLLKTFTDNSSQKTLRYTLAILFVFSFLIPFIGKLAYLDIDFTIPVSYPLFYLLAGHYIMQYKNNIKQKLPAKIGMVGILIITTVLICLTDTETSVKLFNYSSPITATLSLLMFYLFRGMNISGKHKDKIWAMDRLCFGVYLIHPLFIHLAYQFLKYTPLSAQPYQLSTLVFFIIFSILSFFASFIMSKIKLLSKYIL